eukprot:scaffold66034_cov66-Phaeocystis_antarctica.AAC.1
MRMIEAPLRHEIASKTSLILASVSTTTSTGCVEESTNPKPNAPLRGVWRTARPVLAPSWDTPW